MEKIYNKLVRDKIPKIIENDGETPVVRVLNDNEYKKELEKKSWMCYYILYCKKGSPLL